MDADYAVPRDGFQSPDPDGDGFHTSFVPLHVTIMSGFNAAATPVRVSVPVNVSRDELKDMVGEATSANAGHIYNFFTDSDCTNQIPTDGTHKANAHYYAMLHADRPLFVRREYMHLETNADTVASRVSLPRCSFFTTLFDPPDVKTPCWLLALVNLDCALNPTAEKERWGMMSLANAGNAVTARELYKHAKIETDPDSFMELAPTGIDMRTMYTALIDESPSYIHKTTFTIVVGNKADTAAASVDAALTPGVPGLLHDVETDHWATMYQVPVTTATVDTTNLAQERRTYVPIIVDPRIRHFDTKQVAAAPGYAHPQNYDARGATFELFIPAPFMDRISRLTDYTKKVDDTHRCARSGVPILYGPAFYTDPQTCYCLLHKDAAGENIETVKFTNKDGKLVDVPYERYNAEMLYYPAQLDI